MKKVFKEIFLLCAVFLAEVFLVRYFVNINSSVPTDLVVIPSLCALAVWVCVTVEKAPLEFSFQMKTLLLNLLCYASFFIFTVRMEPLAVSLGWPLFAALWFVFAILALGSGFFVFVKPASLYRKFKSYPVESLLGIAAGLSQIFYEVINRKFWQALAFPTMRAVQGILALFGIRTQSPHPYEMVHPAFSARIASGCSGLEGVFFFIFVFCVLAMLDWKKFSGRKLFALLGGGMVLMIALNILRIALFFSLAIWLTERFGNSHAEKWFVWAFHSHAGWILYFIGITLFVSGFFILSAGRKQKRL